MLSRFEKFMRSITEIDLYLHRLTSAEMKDFGLKGNYAIYFTKLQACPEGLTSANLAAACGKDKADVSRDISVLEQKGFIRRIRNSKSLYRARIVLTEAGNRLTNEITKKVKSAVSRIGENISDDDRSCFYSVLDRISANLQQVTQNSLSQRFDEN